VIVQQGDVGDRFYILVRGAASVSRETGGRTVSLGKLHDGDYFGEMALLSHQPRNATVRSLTDCVCLSLPRDLFDRLLASEPDLRENVHRAAAARGGS
jgi:CRP-like cAMP-binding protein